MGPTLAPVTKERDGDLASRGGQSPLLVRVTVRRTAVGTRIERTGTVEGGVDPFGERVLQGHSAAEREPTGETLLKLPQCDVHATRGHVELKDARDLFLGVEVNVRIGELAPLAPEGDGDVRRQQPDRCPCPESDGAGEFPYLLGPPLPCGSDGRSDIAEPDLRRTQPRSEPTPWSAGTGRSACARSCRSAAWADSRTRVLRRVAARSVQGMCTSAPQSTGRHVLVACPVCVRPMTTVALSPALAVLPLHGAPMSRPAVGRPQSSHPVG